MLLVLSQPIRLLGLILLDKRRVLTVKVKVFEDLFWSPWYPYHCLSEAAHGLERVQYPHQVLGIGSESCRPLPISIMMTGALNLQGMSPIPFLLLKSLVINVISFSSSKHTTFN